MTGLMRTRVPARAPRGGARTLWGALLLVCVLALTIAAGAVPAMAASDTQESQQAYEQQLASRQITSATVNRRIGRVHLILKDGTHVYFHYAKGERPKVEAALTAAHVHITVLNPAAAKKEEKAAPKKHKLRYIIGGALIVVVLIVGGVLLFNRRRQQLAE